MPRVLLLATTTGYQTRAFSAAAEKLGVELSYATDRCDLIDDPWRDGAIPIRFHDEDRSVDAIVDAARARPIDGMLVVGDRPTVIAARAAEALGLPGHPPEAAAAAKHKLLARERFRASGMLVPQFASVQLSARSPQPSALSPQPSALSPQPSALSPQRSALGGSQPSALSPEPSLFPCVVKPASLSGSRGVIRADDPPSLAAAIERLRALLAAPDVRGERNPAHETILIESFIPGREYAVEAILDRGEMRLLAIFDKPDPLDGPYFEETIYLTPSAASRDDQRAIEDAIARAAAALGLRHGPIHGECRVNEAGVFVLEVAARPIGGLCARALRFIADGENAIPLEELLLRHALGESPRRWRREEPASGVMMIPIPRRGIYKGVDGVDEAKRVPHVDDVRITAKSDQALVPLPEGASYLGFIFASAARADEVDRALRAAHAALRFRIAAELPVKAVGELMADS
jgi:biotin carboxylase